MFSRGSQSLKKPSCFISKASTMKPGFTKLVWCYVRASVSQQFWCYWHSALNLSVCAGTKVMEKIGFSLPLRGLVCPCALATLDLRHLIDDQIYPTGLPEQFYRLMISSLLCFSLGLLRCGAGGTLQAELLLQLPACFQPLSSLWDPLHLQKDLCSLAHLSSVSWWKDAALEMESTICCWWRDACVLSVWQMDARVVSSECHLASHEAQLPCAVQTQGVWRFRSGIRFQLVCCPSLLLDGNFCAPLYGVDLSFGCSGVRVSCYECSYNELCQYKKMLSGEEGGECEPVDDYIKASSWCLPAKFRKDRVSWVSWLYLYQWYRGSSPDSFQEWSLCCWKDMRWSTGAETKVEQLR